MEGSVDMQCLLARHHDTIMAGAAGLTAAGGGGSSEDEYEVRVVHVVSHNSMITSGLIVCSPNMQVFVMKQDFKFHCAHFVAFKGYRCV